MITVIKKGFSREKIRTVMKRRNVRIKGPELKKYLGSIVLIDDPVILQRKLRDEWE